MQAPPPSSLFFSTVQQRVALARERYFEHGEMPSGLVSDAVLQSWARCLRAHREPDARAAFDPVTASRTHQTLARNRMLLESAQPVLRELESVIRGSGCVYLLTDAQGVVIEASRPQMADGVTGLVTRIGVNLCEQQVGTSAPGIVAKTGTACTVQGGEHFHRNVEGMYCAAAPIRDTGGSLAAVLDISIENASLPFDVPALVGMYATGIENRLLVARSSSPLVLRLQVNPTLFGTPFEGLLALDEDGSVAWMNTTAERLLLGPRNAAAPGSLRVENLLATGFEQFLETAHAGTARLIRACNGLSVWVTVQLLVTDGLSGTRVSLGDPPHPPVSAHPQSPTPAPSLPPEPTALPAPVGEPPVSLRDASRQAIDQALAAAGGNVSKAARALGVSRGLLYRHLRQNGEA